MWSDKDTEKIGEAQKLFDLECEHPERGSVIVQESIPLEEAVKIAEEGGVEEAEFKLDCAFTDQNCVGIQRPGKYPEMLVPHDWDA